MADALCIPMVVITKECLLQTKTRKRRWATKVKTGCLTCRTRRIKCDENKPKCNRCVMAGRECVNRFSHVAMPRWEGKVAVQPTYSPTPIVADSTELEREMFYCLCTGGAVKVAGPFDHEFWSIHLPRATQTYRAIWHASISLAAIHSRLEYKRSSQASEELYVFALQQYNKSMQHLIAIDPHQSDPDYENQEIILMASILFAGICSLQGDVGAAEMHISNGVQLFYKWRFWDHFTKPSRQARVLDSNSLVTLLNRFEFQYSLSKPPRFDWEALPTCPPTAPFSSATDAYSQLQLIINNLVKVCRTQIACHVVEQPQPVPEKRHTYRYQYSTWKRFFQQLTSTDQRSMLILQLYSLCTEVLLYMDLCAVELCWDDYHDSWQRMLDLANQIFNTETKPDGAGSKDTALYSFTPMACDPLLGVASCCRDDTIRRGAIALMKKWPLRDGIVDYNMTAHALEAVMLYEEESRESGGGGVVCPECECIPGSFLCGPHRVIYRRLEQLGQREGKLTMTTVEDVVRNRPGKTVLVRW